MHAYIPRVDKLSFEQVQGQCQASCLNPGGPPQLAPCHAPMAFSYPEAGLHK